MKCPTSAISRERLLPAAIPPPRGAAPVKRGESASRSMTSGPHAWHCWAHPFNSWEPEITKKPVLGEWTPELGCTYRGTWGPPA